MWQLYCLPGLIITRFAFLFPGQRSGDITATRRRNESGCAHFMFATIFWAVAGLYAVGYFSGPRPLAKGRQLAVVRDQRAIVGVEQTSTDADVGQPTPAVVDAEQRAGSTNEHVEAALSEEETILADPQSFANIAKAVSNAVQDGSAKKWKVGKLKGYAVPSEPNSVGCRAVSVSISNRDDARTATITVCPDAAGI